MNLPTWLENLNPLDAGGVMIVLLCALIGLKRGFAAELAGSLAMLGGIAAALLLVDPFARWIDARADWNPSQIYICALFGAFVLVLLIVAALYAILTRSVKVSFITPVELVGGAAVGGLRATALVFLVVFLCQMAPYPRLNAWFGPPSRLGAFVQLHQAELSAAILHEVQDSRETMRQRHANHEQPRERGK